MAAQEEQEPCASGHERHIHLEGICTFSVNTPKWGSPTERPCHCMKFVPAKGPTGKKAPERN